MIRVSGETYNMKETLKDNGFNWDKKNKTWWQMVGVSLNHILESIRPEIITLNVKLSHVDVSGKPLNDNVLKIKLKPTEGERDCVDYYKSFMTGSVVHVITSNTEALSPPNPKKENKWKELPTIDEGFF